MTSETEDVADSFYELKLPTPTRLNIIALMLPRAEDLSGLVVKIIDTDGNEQCTHTFNSPANDGTKKFFEYDCDGRLHNHITATVIFERAAGKVSIVQVGLLHGRDCS